MRTHDGYDAWDSYERAEDAMGENVPNGNDDIESNGRRFQETPSDVAATMRSLIKSQEQQCWSRVPQLQKKLLCWRTDSFSEDIRGTATEL